MKYNRILIVVGFFPYPCYFGGAYDVYGRIEALKKAGYSIDLLCSCKTDPEEKDIEKVRELADTIYFTTRKNRIINLISTLPLQAASRNKLKNIVLEKEYDLVILESESTMPVLLNPTLKTSKTVLRVHNNESEYFFQLGNSTGNIFKKLYYYLDAIKFKSYSKKAFSKADRLWFISADEMEAFSKNCTFKEKAFHLPAPSGQNPVEQDLSGKNVLFIGSLFMPNNINAIDWYLKNIHTLLVNRFPDYSFTIAGSTGDVKEEDIINRYSGYKNLTILFNVPNLTALYANASLFINPMQFGTGVKLKSLNAIVNGLPLVSTYTGSEGIGLIDKEMFLRADTPKDFYDAIEHIFMAPQQEVLAMVKKAQNFLSKNDYVTLLKNEIDGLFEQV